MKIPNSTHEILLRKHLNEDIDKKWYKWGLEMLDKGFESESLYELVGLLMNKSKNQFELHHLANKIFCDLNLSYDNEKKLVINYATSISIKVLKKEINIENGYKDLRFLYYKLDYSTATKIIQDFFLLSCAKQNLETADFQYYWDNANKSNIDKICTNYMKEWILKYPIDK